MRTAAWLRWSILLLALFAAGCNLRLHSPGVTLQLVNHQSAAVTNLAFYFPGGSFGVPSVPAGGSRSRWLRPIATGELKIDYDDASGHHSISPLTLQKNDSGTVIINFLEQGKVTVEDHRQTAQ